MTQTEATVDTLASYDISDEQAARLWTIVAAHKPVDGECPRCEASPCRTRGEAIGSLKLAGLYAAGPPGPVVPPEALPR